MSSAVANQHIDTSMSRKRARTGASAFDREVPEQGTLKELMANSFKTGDHFKSHRGKHFRAFGASYTHSLVTDCLNALTREGKLISESDITTFTERYIVHEFDDFVLKNPELKVICKGILEHVHYHKPSSFPLKSHMVVDVPQLTTVNLHVPLMPDHFEKCNQQPKSYLSSLKFVSWMIQDMPFFQCENPHEGALSYKKQFADLIEADEFIPNIMKANQRMYQLELEKTTVLFDSLEKKQHAQDSFVQSRQEFIRSLENEKNAMQAKLNEIESAGFMKLLEDISPIEKKAFVQNIHSLFDDKAQLLSQRIQKERSDLDAYKTESARETWGQNSYTLSKKQMAYYQNICQELESLSSNTDVHDTLKKFIAIEFNDYVYAMQPFFDILTADQRHAKALLKLISKLIASKEVILEAVHRMSAEISATFELYR